MKLLLTLQERPGSPLLMPLVYDHRDPHHPRESPRGRSTDVVSVYVSCPNVFLHVTGVRYNSTPYVLRPNRRIPMTNRKPISLRK